MNHALLAEMDELLAEVLDREEPERARLLAARCAGRPELRREIETLVLLSEREIQPLIEPVRAFVQSLEDHDEPDELGLPMGEVVGAYRIVERLGRGGMGMVYLAERVDGSFEKRVALKVLPNAGSRPALVRRFEQERQILAKLEHPAIARLLDGGVDRRGLPYLVLEHVDGLPIDQHCDRLRLTVEERLRLVIEAAEAVQAAHRNLIIHRDLKPSNLMVTSEGRVKLLDFGIAKLIDPEADDRELTRHERLPMTPSYASPEQVTGAPITTVADIYQLGLLLYELVTGHRPQETTADSLAELVKVVQVNEPIPPSRAVLLTTAAKTAETLAALRRSTPSRLARRLRPELDAIVGRALEKEPEKRYASARDFANDLKRFLDGQPVEAQRPTVFVKLKKWAGRNRLATALIGAAILLTVGYATAVTFQARALAAERDRARLEAEKATQVEKFLIGLFESSNPLVAQGEDPRASEILGRGVERIDSELVDQPEVHARLSSTLGHVLGLTGRYQDGIALLDRALKQQKKLLGSQETEVGETAHRLGVLLKEVGRYQEALALFQEAVALYRAQESNSTQLVAAVSLLGHTHAALGDNQTALQLFTENLPARQLLGDEHEIAHGLSDLGLTYFALGRYEESVEHHRQARALDLRALGLKHPDLAAHSSNLALSLHSIGAHAEAQPLFDEAISSGEKVFGSDSLRLAIRLIHSARNLNRLGELERSETQLVRSYAILKAKVSEDHVRFSHWLHAQGELRLEQGRLAEAEESLAEALARQRQRFGQSSKVVWVLMTYGRLRVAQGRPEEARAFWQEALALVKGMDGAEKKFQTLLHSLDRQDASTGGGSS